MKPEISQAVSELVAKRSQKIIEEIVQARRAHTEDALKDRLKQQLLSVSHEAKEVVDTGKTDFADLPEKEKKASEKVLEPVVENLIAVKENFIQPPGATPTDERKAAFAILHRLADQGLQSVTQGSSLYTIVSKALYTNGYILFSPKGGQATQFERDFQSLRSHDATTAKLLGDVIVEAARNGEIPNLTKDNAKEKFAKVEAETVKEKMARIEKEYDAWKKEAGDWSREHSGYIDSLRQTTILERAKVRIIEENNKKIRDGVEPWTNEEIDNKADYLAEEVRGRLETIGRIFTAKKVVDPRSTETRSRDDMVKAYKTELMKLLTEKLISNDEYDMLINKHLKDLLPILEKAPDPPDSSLGTLRERALSMGVIITDPKHLIILETLEDPRKLIEHLSRRKDGKFDFEAYWVEVKDLCDSILTIIDIHKTHYFEQAFNPMYYGHFFEMLVKSVRDVGEALAAPQDNNHEWRLGQEEVEIEDFSLEVEANKKGVGSSDRVNPYTELKNPYLNKTKTYLHRAMNVTMVDYMEKLVNVNEYLHNVDRIVAEGQGFETLGKYAEKITPQVIDWFFRSDKDMNDAYHFYIKNLKRSLYMDNRFISVTTGMASDKEGLTEPQTNALYALISKKVGAEGIDKDNIIEARMRRKIRLATSLAKGYTGDYWGIYLSGQPPTKEERHPIGRRKIGVDAQGKDTYEEVYESQVGKTWGSIYDHGIERMLGILKPGYNMMRFGNPGHIPALPFVLQLRQLNAPSEFFQHSDFYEYKKLYEDALYNGATPEFLKMHRKYLSYGEFLQANLVNIWARGGWRQEVYQNYIWMSETNPGKYDYAKTIGQLMAVGGYPLKNFINNLDINKVPDEVFKEYYNGRTLEQLKNEMGEEALKIDFKKKNYEELLFDQLMDASPTMAMGFERRQFTPKGEQTVYDDVLGYLQSQFESPTMTKDNIRLKMSPLYIGALEIVQEIKQKHTKQQLWEYGYTNATFKELRGFIKSDGFKLSVEDLQSDAVRKALEVYFDAYKQNIPTVESYQKGDLSLDFLKFSHFMDKTLPGFLKTLRTSIDKERVVLTGDGDEMKFEKKKLSNRFTWLMLGNDGEGEGVLNYDFGGEDTDFNLHLFSGAGARVVSRYYNETAGYEKNVVPNIAKLTEVAMEKFVKKGYKSAEDVEKATNEFFVPLLNEMNQAMKNIAYVVGDEWVTRQVIFLNRMVRSDDVNRMMFVGKLTETARRNWGLGESSFMQDQMKSKWNLKSTAFNADQSEAFMKTALMGVGVATDEANISENGYKEFRLFGFKVRGPDIYEMEPVKDKDGNKVYDRNGHLLEKFKMKKEMKKLLGFLPIKIATWKRVMKKPCKFNIATALASEKNTLKDRVKNRLLPIFVLIFALIMWQLANAAEKKNKGK